MLKKIKDETEKHFYETVALDVTDVTTDARPVQRIVGINNIIKEINRIHEAYALLKKSHDAFKNFYINYKDRPSHVNLYPELLAKFENIKMMYDNIVNFSMNPENRFRLPEMIRNFKDQEIRIYEDIKNIVYKSQSNHRVY